MQIPSPIPLHRNKRFRRTLIGAASCGAVENLQAGGDVTLLASNTPLAQNTNTPTLPADITVQGSSISAGNTATLAADGSINLLAAQNTASQTSANTSSSGSIGVSFNLGAKSTGVSVGVSASKGKGSANGSDTTYSNTHITAGDKVSLQSGADTSLKGAVITAPQVQAQVGRNLNIESLQDSSDYHSQQSNKGISLSVPITGTGSLGGSISAGKANINSGYTSTTEQSAIRAGDGGFQVAVGGNSKLLGGQITSTQAAIENDKNSFATGGSLTTTDINNTADYKAKAVGVQLGTSVNHTGQYQASGTSAGVGKDSGSASSSTQAAISDMAGDKTARTGDAETGIAPIFDAGKVQADINAQVQITQAFGQQASKAVGDYAQSKLDEALLLRLTGHEQEAQAIEALWGESGSLRLAAHTVIGGLTGGSSGAAGAALGTLTAPAVANALAQAGIEGPLASTLTALASTATGAAVGGTAGGAAALNEAENNYLAHWQQELREQELALAKSLIAQRLIQGKWAAISTGQDAAYLTGMGLGAAKELVDMVRAIPQLPQAVASLLQDPSALKELPTAYVLALEQSHSNYLQALETAGVEGATAAGVYFIEMASLLASPAVAGSGSVNTALNWCRA